MASPVTARQPLSQRSINTPSFTTSSATTTSTYKPLVGQKRTHSQSTGQENNSNSNNIQQQILTNPATFKLPSLPRHPHYALQAAASQKTRPATRPVIQAQPQFKQPLPRTGVIVTRQRQQTNDPAVTTTTPVGEDRDTEEVIEWRRQMKRTLSVSTFYFDGVEESFKDTSTRIICRHGGVRTPLHQQKQPLNRGRK